jgi:Zn-finger nucleic acid-binding protein
MKCPACFHELTETQVGRVVVDVCEGGCGGIWFDAFELKQVDEVHEAAGEHLLNIRRDPNLRVDFLSKRACPRCESVKLKRHLFNPKSKVEVDHCPSCAGYWLDAGELEKIRLEKNPGASAASGPRGLVTTEVIRYVYRMQIEMRASQRATD